MKVHVLDFLFSGIAILLILAGTIAVITNVVAPITRVWCDPYHILVDGLMGLAVYGVLSALMLRLLLRLRPLRPGDYDMKAAEFTYWKLLIVILKLGQWALKPFSCTFLQPSIARLFGARVGDGVAMDGVLGEPFLLTVGSGAVLGWGSVVVGSVIADGRIVIAPVRIGAHATVGVNAVVLSGCTIGDYARLAIGATLVPGSVIPPGETWRGNPARKWSVGAVKVGTVGDQVS